MPEGGTVTPINPGLLARISDAVRYTISGVTPETWMSPNQPLSPIAPQAAGRLWNLPVGYNLYVQPRSSEGGNIYQQLRYLADNCDITRLLIETRKDQLEALPWMVRPKGNAKVGADKELQARIKQITTFLEEPDGFHGWHEWLRMLVEDMLVVDAASLYKSRDRKGRLIGLEVMDGTTLTIKIDEFGRIPKAPDPAYQQVLQGVPAVDYTVDDVMYLPRNRRSHDLYGFSPVEQVTNTMNIIMRRTISQMEYYTDSNLPAGLLEAPKDMTSDKIAEWFQAFHSKLTGNTATRSGLHPVLNGVKYQEMKKPPLVDVADEWYTRIVCYAFSIPPQPFIKEMNRATAETAKSAAEQEGLVPIQLWVKRFIDRVITKEFQSPDLEFSWQDDREIDPEKAMLVETGYVKAGIRSVNQARERLGDEPIADPAYDVPMLATATGFVATLSPEQQEQQRKDAAAQQQAAMEAKNKLLDSGKPDGDKDPKEEKADKAAGYSNLTKGVRRTRPIPFDRVLVRKARSGMKKEIAKVLKATGKSVAEQIRSGKVTGLSKDAGDDIDLSGLFAMVDVTQEFMESVTADASNLALAQIGVTNQTDLVNQVADRAVEYARDRAAEMVGMRRTANGKLVPNPNAEWRIDEATRDEIRSIIANGLEDNIGRDEIAELIQESTAFSEERSQLIADTEVARANQMGVLNGYMAGREIGVKVKKQWWADENPCEDCVANADEGPIDLDDLFPSGDDAPPAHPNCECAIIPVVEDEETGDDTEE